MKHLYKVVLLLTPLILSSCGGGSQSSVTSSSTTNSESSSSSITSGSEIISETSSSSELPISELNPMNEPLIHHQYYLNHIGDIYNTWKSYQGRGITIAVIDVGFKSDHPDFYYEDGTSKVSEKSAAFKYNTTQGKVEVTPGNSYENLSIHYDDEYNNDHGTFCAGVAAAGINGTGVIGIAPLAELMLLKTDGCPYSINEAFKYAADNGAKVVTISIGSYNDANYSGDLRRWSSLSIPLYNAFDDAVDYCLKKQTVVISAAGNGGEDSEHSRTEYTYPGASIGVIGVGGLKANETTRVWEGSSYNSSKSYEFCDVFAPADGMYGCCEYSSSKYDGGYDSGQNKYKWRGTSFASPIVAGLAALYFEKNPNATVTEFEKDLTASSHIFSDTESGLSSTNIGKGWVDAGKLLDTKHEQKINIKVKYTGSSLYAFAWNDAGTKSLENLDWPGKKLNKTDGYYTVEIDPKEYQNLLFNNGGDSYKTINLSPTSFIYDKYYDLSSPVVENNLRIGLYH